MSTTRLVAVAILLLIAAPIWAEEATDTFNRLYGEELKAAEKSKDASVALAAKMLEGAKKAEANPPLLALLCEKTCELGAKDPKGYNTVLAAADLLSSNIPEKAAACQEIVLTIRQEQYAKARGEDRIKTAEAFLDVLLSTACDKAQDGNFDDALKRCRQALTVARDIKSPNVEGIGAHIKHLMEQQKVAGKVPQLKEDLKADPENREKRSELIRLLLVELDNPEEAAKYVDDKCEADLQKCVPAAAKGVDLAPEVACPMLANWYLGLSQAKDMSPGGKASMLRRAKAYCERFCAVHTQEDKERSTAAVTLKKVEADLKALGAAFWTPPIKMFGRGQWVDLLGLIDLEKDTLVGTWRFQDGALRVRVGDDKGWNCIRVPVAPLGDYEIEVKFKRTASPGNLLRFLLPLSDTSTLFDMWMGRRGDEPCRCTLNRVDGKIREAWRNPMSSRTRPIVPDRAYTLRIRVTTAKSQAQISASIDDTQVMTWTGERSNLSVPPDCGFPDVKCLGVGDNFINVWIQGFRLRMLTGRAIPLRPPEAKPKPASTPEPPK